MIAYGSTIDKINCKTKERLALMALVLTVLLAFAEKVRSDETIETQNTEPKLRHFIKKGQDYDLHSAQ